MSHNPKVSQGHFGNIKGDLTYQGKFSRAKRPLSEQKAHAQSAQAFRKSSYKASYKLLQERPQTCQQKQLAKPLAN